MTITLDQPQKQLSESLWELKETAKWARHPGEKQAAIRTLSARGEEALTSLEEILAVTAYADIRSTCEEAIRSVREKNLSSSSSAIANEKNNNSSSSATAEKPKKADANRAEEDGKNKEAANTPATGKSSKANNSGSSSNDGGSSMLADLPP